MARRTGAPREHHEGHQRAQRRNVLPCAQRRKVVLAEKIKNLRFRVDLLHFAGGIDCERGAFADDLAVAPGEPGFPGDRCGHHFRAQLRGCGRALQLVRRDPCGDKNHAVEPKSFECFASENQVSVVDRIEAASVEAEFAEWNHLDSGTKIWFPRCMPSNDPGQLLLVGVPGPELDSDSARLFRKIQPGGFILFGRNIQSPVQLRKLIDDLRDLSDVEPVVTIDQEGGRVSRLKLIGNEPPNAQQLRDRDDLELIRDHGDITGRLLRIFGFNMDLCPVLDISFDDAADNSLRGRCYGRSAGEVIRKAGAFNDGLRGAGILSCGKHFPGYSSAGLDPHHELPQLVRSRGDMEASELAVFRAFAKSVDSMMIGHIAISGLDPVNRPASLSPAIIRDLLRGDLGFEGLIMTDDLDMGAILNHYGFDETMRLGIEAGNDLLMICHRIEMAAAAKSAIEPLGDKLQPALESVARCKSRLSPPAPFSLESFHAVDAEVWRLRVAVLGEEAAAARSPDDGKRSPVELY